MTTSIEPQECGSTVLHRPADELPPSGWQSFLLGRPLATADAPHQTIGKAIGLAVFSSDAMSSVAYAPQEMLLILAMAGAGAFVFATPISLAIVALLTILTISYEQTIHAYPGGGGAYIVARDNLGDKAALVAGSALLLDYILTVSVSIASGVAQLVSAVPEWYDARVMICIGMVLFIMLINLRGVKESGAIFAVPTYFFLVMMYVTVGIGFFRLFAGNLGAVASAPPLETLHGAQTVSLFLILRAFAGGTTALTGVEAISNGITAFKEPRSHNAGITLIWMSLVLGSLMLGITYLSVHIGAVPSEAETVISQLTRTALGDRGLPYLLTIASTTLILVLAANTAFADFPRLGALTAADGFLPRQLAYKGSRLVYSRGIAALAFVACLLIVLFQASVTHLIPLYAIGVFMSFTLSQTGMARRWWKIGHLSPGESKKERGSTISYMPGWQSKLVINSVGAVATALVMVIFAVTKFQDGAWIVIILVPVLVAIFLRIHRHYRELAGALSLESYGEPPNVTRHRVIMPIGGVHRGTLAALHYAESLSADVTAVHVSMDPEETERIKEKWDYWGGGVRLVVLDSPYRLLLEPLTDYINEVAGSRQPGETITIVVPQFVPRHRWQNLLHMNTASLLRMLFLFKPDIVITDVPYQVSDPVRRVGVQS